MSSSPPTPATISVHVTMGAPSFVPGSLLTSTITLRADRPKPTTSRSAFNPLRYTTSHPPTASSTSLSNFGKEPSARIDFVVCEVSGRWSSDRAWVLPHAHGEAREESLDNHLQEPVAEHGFEFSSKKGDYPWAGALADANSVGGGGRLGHTGVVFRSQALVVCEREQIPVGSRVSFGVSCVLPESMPPTLRGVAMRYSYAVVVVVGFSGCEVPKIVRVPFRVVSAGGTGRDAERATEVMAVPVPRGVGPFRNRFLEENDRQALSMESVLLKGSVPDDIEIALALSLNGRLTPYKGDEESAKGEEESGLSFVRDIRRGSDGGSASGRKRNAIPVYGISHEGVGIARMYLGKRAHYLGDSVSAIFYFTGEKPCYRLGATLEFQEVIRKEHAVGEKRSGSGGNGVEEVVFRKVYGEHGEFVMANRNTHVTFSIPHDAAPSFSTSVVSLRWMIHFMFLIPKAMSPVKGDRNAHMVRPGGDLDEIEPLLDELTTEENIYAREEVAGWEGGTWAGEDPANWTHLPQKDVDVLRWTLPLVVSGQWGSQWGSRSSGTVIHTIS